VPLTAVEEGAVDISNMIMLSIRLPILSIALAGFFVVRLIMRSAQRAQLIQNGQLANGKVVSISQTGTSVNQVPEMQVTVDVDLGGQPRRVTFRQLIDLGSMPRAGESVYVMVDPANPDRATLAPPQSVANAQSLA